MKTLRLSYSLILTLLAFSKEIFAYGPASFKRDPFIQGGCLIPQPHDLAGVNIQAAIEVKKDGRTKYKLLTQK